MVSYQVALKHFPHLTTFYNKKDFRDRRWDFLLYKKEIFQNINKMANTKMKFLDSSRGNFWVKFKKSKQNIRIIKVNYLDFHEFIPWKYTFYSKTVKPKQQCALLNNHQTYYKYTWWVKRATSQFKIILYQLLFLTNDSSF